MTCEHPFPDRAEHRGVRVFACRDCRGVSFYDRREEMPPLAALTELFGRYDLAGTLPVIGLPAREALAYAAPDPAARESLRAVPPRLLVAGRRRPVAAPGGRPHPVRPQLPRRLPSGRGLIVKHTAQPTDKGERRCAPVFWP